jgi:hypothetical protein
MVQGSRGLAVITVVFAATAGMAGWAEAQPGVALMICPEADAAVLLPAAVLLVAGTGRLLVVGARRLVPPIRRPGRRTHVA